MKCAIISSHHRDRSNEKTAQKILRKPGNGSVGKFFEAQISFKKGINEKKNFLKKFKIKNFLSFSYGSLIASF